MTLTQVIAEGILECCNQIADDLAAGRELDHFQEKFKWSASDPTMTTFRSYLLGDIQKELDELRQYANRLQGGHQDSQELPF